MSANQWVHQKDITCMYKENYTTWRDNEFFKESDTYMYVGGGEVGEKWPQLGALKSPLAHYQDA